MVKCQKLTMGRGQVVRRPAMAGYSGVDKQELMYKVYILKSRKDNKLYIGQTNDIKNRIKRHNRGEVRATRNRRPLKLITYKDFESRKEAMKMEKYLKSLKGGNEFKKIMKQWGVAKW